MKPKNPENPGHDMKWDVFFYVVSVLLRLS